MHEKTVPVQISLYGLEAVYKASYAFLDRAFIRLEGDPAGIVRVLFRAKPETSEEDLDRAAGEFENELIHQALRVRVAASNQKIREFIVARALTSAEGTGQTMARQPQQPPAMDEQLEREIEKLLAEVESKADEDPLRIVAPWEKKAPVEGAKK